MSLTRASSATRSDDVSVRVRAATALRPRLPKTGWLVRALNTSPPFISASSLLAEWGAA